MPHPQVQHCRQLTRRQTWAHLTRGPGSRVGNTVENPPITPTYYLYIAKLVECLAKMHSH
jgi:hypothetical protein